MLQLCKQWVDEIAVMEGAVREVASSGQQLSILEAGCGRKWELNLTGLSYKLTGVDVDKAALDLRIHQARDMDIALLGDLRTIDLPAASFDVIYNSFVLEHISESSHVMYRFIEWLRPGGLLIVRVPDPQSVKGLITRVTPHWFHVFYFRYIRGDSTAGQPGFPPYPTMFGEILWRRNFEAFCKVNQLAIVGVWGDGYYSLAPGWRGKMLRWFSVIIQGFSMGRIRADHTNLLYVVRK